MKQDQMQQAQHLYFQTDLSKTEIASNIGMSRRTLHNWIRQNNWDKLKKSAEYIPTFLAENCYQVLGNLTEHLLSEDRKDKPVTPQEVSAMYKLTLTINKLKTRSTVNESMENFTHLSEHIFDKDPELALAIQPYIQDYITAQVAHDRTQYRPAKMQQHGFIPNQDTEKVYKEAKLDEEDLRFWAEQQKAEAVTSPSAAVASSAKEAPSAADAPVLSNAEGSAKEAASATHKPKQSIRDMIRHTSATGPGKAYRQSRLTAA